MPVNLAVSLHATTDAVRDVLVPLNRRFPLARAARRAARAPAAARARRPVFFEYTLIEGVNDSLEDAAAWSRCCAGFPSKLNLIPMNPHPDAPLPAARRPR